MAEVVGYLDLSRRHHHCAAAMLLCLSYIVAGMLLECCTAAESALRNCTSSQSLSSTAAYSTWCRSVEQVV